MFTVIDGAVSDPFMGSHNQYILVKDAAENNWLWLNSQTYAITFWQQYRVDLGKILVIYFP